jgi:hypothetical protein
VESVLLLPSEATQNGRGSRATGSRGKRWYSSAAQPRRISTVPPVNVRVTLSADGGCRVSNDCPMARHPGVVRLYGRNERRWSFRDLRQSVDVALTPFRRRRRGGKRLVAVAECIGDEWKRGSSKSCHPHGEQPQRTSPHRGSDGTLELPGQ